MDLQLTGKTALVTGASIGIGRGIALAFAREGVRLAIVARRAELLEGVAAEIAAGGGARPTLIVEDLLQEGAPERIAAAALAGLGAVDILVNNAGGSRPFKLDAGEEQWQEAMTLNFTRQRQLTHRLLDQMMQRKWGRIVNITGKSEPDGINGAFCAKAAVHAWAKGLSREVGRHGITVNSIPPGRIMSEQIRRNYTPEYRQWQADNEIPVGRYGEPEDIAGLVCYPGLAAGRLHHRHRHPRRRWPAPLPVLTRPQSAGSGRLLHHLVVGCLLHQLDGMQAVLLVLVAFPRGSDLLAVGGGEVPAPLAPRVLPDMKCHGTGSTLWGALASRAVSRDEA